MPSCKKQFILLFAVGIYSGNAMLYDLNTETIIAVVIWFIVMFLFAITLIAGVGSILSQYWAKIAPRLKAEFNARFSRFFPGRQS